MIRRLCIGGPTRSLGWEVLDIVPKPHVDHVGNASDLSRFPEATFAEVYASHVLEHLDFREDEVLRALREWRRVLVPGGKLYLSVPDLEVLAQLLLRKDLTLNDRFFVMRMLFGGHTHQYDYHYLGFTPDILFQYLRQAGFSEIQRVVRLGLFNDASEKVFHGTRISLNVTAHRPAN
jgi:predicted SAM-dependent methyltransferase